MPVPSPRRRWLPLALAALALPLGAAAVSTAHSGPAAPMTVQRRAPTVPAQVKEHHAPKAELTPAARVQHPPPQVTPEAWSRYGRPAGEPAVATPERTDTPSPPPYTLRGKSTRP